jgi:hypothetical protein
MSRCFDSKAALNGAVSSVSSFNACCRLSTSVLLSKADCNLAENSLSHLVHFVIFLLQVTVA